MKQKKILLNEYYTEIYPRRLWVTADINAFKLFDVFNADGSIDQNPNIEEVAERCVALTCSVRDKETKTYGVLVFICYLKEMTTEVIAHESVHVADYFCQSLGINSENFSEGNEHYAYLVGYAAGCISETLTKIKKNDSRRKQNVLGNRKAKH